MEKIHLGDIVDQLEADIHQYRVDAIATAKADEETGILPHDPSQNEWVLQIADIYKAAYGEELDLENLVVD